MKTTLKTSETSFRECLSVVYDIAMNTLLAVEAEQGLQAARDLYIQITEHAMNHIENEEVNSLETSKFFIILSNFL